MHKHLSRVLLSLVGAINIFFPFFVQADTSSTSGWNKSNYSETGLPGKSGTSIQSIIINFVEWLLVIIGAFAIIAFVVAGILYLTSAGDDNRMEKAKDAMIAAIIGVIVALGGYVVIQAVDSFLNASGTI